MLYDVCCLSMVACCAMRIVDRCRSLCAVCCVVFVVVCCGRCVSYVAYRLFVVGSASVAVRCRFSVVLLLYVGVGC